MKIRKHLKDVYTWTKRVPTVVDLNRKDLSILNKNGSDKFDTYLKSKDQFPVPALDISTLRPISKTTNLVSNVKTCTMIVYPYGNTFYKKLANKISKIIPKISLPVISDRNFDLKKFRNENLLLLGGSHENKVSIQLAFWNLCFSNALVPGKGGLYIQTLNGLVYKRQNIIIAVADSSTADSLLNWIKKGLIYKENKWTLNRLDCVKPGKSTASKLGTTDRLFSSMVKEFSRNAYPGKTISFKKFTRFLIDSFDSGGPKVNRDNGHVTIPNIIRMYYAYRYTGDIRFLKVFRETLLGLADYFLNIPGGASYPSDYDFYLGNLITCWSQAEAEDIFSEQDRLLITNLLLASVRMVARYQKKFWAVPEGKLRHNHATFPALSLYWAYRYFSKCYNIREANEWKRTAEKCFSGPIENVFKHTENSNSYQWIVPAHKLIYDCAKNVKTVMKKGMIIKTAFASVIATDNFGYATPYGDAEPIVSTGSQLSLQSIVAILSKDDRLASVVKRSYQALGNKPALYIPRPGWGTLLWTEPDEKKFPDISVWEKLPLDDHIRKRYQPTMPAKYLWDKIALRTGWRDKDQYLLFEPYSCDSHAHFDMNSIISYNHRGRMWLVDNGYGKPVDEKNVMKAYNLRERGPKTHNTVIFYNPDGDIIIPPPFAAVTACKQQKNMFFLQSTLSNISSCTWQRTLLIKLDAFLLVIDRISAGKHGKVSHVDCQFNALGKSNLDTNGWHLKQSGVQARLQTAGSGDLSCSEYLTAGWESTFRKYYHFAKPPIKQLSRLANVKTDDELYFCSLFEVAKQKNNFAYCLKDNKVIGNFTPGISFEGIGMNISTRKNQLTIDCLPGSLLPQDLRISDFGPTGERRRV